MCSEYTSSIDTAKMQQACDELRREYLAESARRRHVALSAFILSTMHAAFDLQRCIDVGEALDWPEEATKACEQIALIICREFRTQFGLELFGAETKSADHS